MEISHFGQIDQHNSVVPDKYRMDPAHHFLDLSQGFAKSYWLEYDPTATNRNAFHSQVEWGCCGAIWNFVDNHRAG